jgi:hypothetical protein
MESERQTVTVSLESVEALAEPQFVLEFDGKIYVTMALLEFDPNDPGMDEDLQSDLGELQAMLSGERTVSGNVVGAAREPLAMAQSESRT